MDGWMDGWVGDGRVCCCMLFVAVLSRIDEVCIPGSVSLLHALHCGWRHWAGAMTDVPPEPERDETGSFHYEKHGIAAFMERCPLPWTPAVHPLRFAFLRQLAARYSHSHSLGRWHGARFTPHKCSLLHGWLQTASHDSSHDGYFLRSSLWATSRYSTSCFSCPLTRVW